jgi:hypothetical protein
LFAAEDNRYLAAAGSTVVEVVIITSDILFTTNAVSHGRARLQAGAPCGVEQQQQQRAQVVPSSTMGDTTRPPQRLDA